LCYDYQYVSQADNVLLADYVYKLGDIKAMDNKQLPILVFDSGAGGISVLRELVKIMPEEDFVFFGDSANAPYGTKSVEQIQDLTISTVEKYRTTGTKACAIACNTATSAAVRLMRGMFPDFPMVGIEPAVKPAVKKHPGGRILVMATPMTIHGRKLHNLISEYDSEAEIIPLACPGLMEFVEDGKYNSMEVVEFLKDLLKPYVDEPVDAVVLGCTHYPFLRDKIQMVLGDKVDIFDGAEGTARELKRRLAEAGLLLDDSSKKGTVDFESSDPSSEKIELFKRLFNA